MIITLNQIKKHDPCLSGWAKLLKSLGKTKADDKPLSLMYILESNGIKDALWALGCLEYKDYCLLNANIAESVLHIFEEKYPDDKRPREAIGAVRKFNRGEITEGELESAAIAASAAAYEADYATDSAAYAASYAATDATYSAADYATDAAAYDAAGCADYAEDAYAADYAAKWEEIEQIFIKHFREKE